MRSVKESEGDQRTTARTANKPATTLVKRDGLDDDSAPPLLVLVVLPLLLLLLLLLPPVELLGAKGSGRPL